MVMLVNSSRGVRDRYHEHGFPQSSGDGLPGAVSMQTCSYHPVFTVLVSPGLRDPALLAVAQTGNRSMAPISEALSSEAHSGMLHKMCDAMSLWSALR